MSAAQAAVLGGGMSLAWGSARFRAATNRRAGRAVSGGGVRCLPAIQTTSARLVPAVSKSSSKTTWELPEVDLWGPAGECTAFSAGREGEGAGGWLEDSLLAARVGVPLGVVETREQASQGGVMPGSSAGGPPGGSEPPQNDYFAQTGLAIRTLREEVPLVFAQDISYDIFTDDIGFIETITTRDPEKQHIIMGKDKYKGMYKTVRWHGKFFFSKLKVDILRIWQPKDKTIAVRWTVAAVPRLLNGIIDSTFYLDGISEYKLNDEGFIYQHKVSNVDLGTGQSALQWSSFAKLLAGNSQGPVPTMIVGGDVSACEAHEEGAVEAFR
mmetsp:Transcript_2141/g.7652  ORF Transcript_2141/g.7652 Transcript_2141/m.7652 type:complete len:326 (+) Transcript_2141:200-1177(+)